MTACPYTRLYQLLTVTLFQTQVLSTSRGFTEEEDQYFADAARKAYVSFITKAAASRNMSVEALNEVRIPQHSMCGREESTKYFNFTNIRPDLFDFLPLPLSSCQLCEYCLKLIAIQKVQYAYPSVIIIGRPRPCMDW